MAIPGLRDTNQWLVEQRPKDWLETILLLFPSTKQQAPLTALRAVMKKKVTTDPEYSWFEKKFDDQRIPATASFTNVATAITVSDSSGMKADHLLYVEQTGEIMRVTTPEPVSPFTSVNVVRGQAGTAGTAVTLGAGVNPNLLIIGTAHQEGSNAPTSISRNPVKRNNFTQIFRNTLGMTRTAKNTKLRTGAQVVESKRECLEYHTVEMERATFFGKPFEDLTGADPRRFTGGLIHFIDTFSPGDQSINWATDADMAAKDMTAFEIAIERFFRFGSTEKIGWCGNRFLLNLQSLVRKNTDYTIQTGLKEYGIAVMRLMTPFGTLVLKVHPLFNRIPDGTDYFGWSSGMVVTDMDNIVWRPLQGSDTQFESNLQANGLDGMLSGYLTEGGYEFHHPDTFGYIRGFTVANVG